LPTSSPAAMPGLPSSRRWLLQNVQDHRARARARARARGGGGGLMMYVACLLGGLLWQRQTWRRHELTQALPPSPPGPHIWPPCRFIFPALLLDATGTPAPSPKCFPPGFPAGSCTWTSWTPRARCSPWPA
jgi:hypothetical protein